MGMNEEEREEHLRKGDRIMYGYAASVFFGAALGIALDIDDNIWLNVSVFGLVGLATVYVAYRSGKKPNGN